MLDPVPTGGLTDSDASRLGDHVRRLICAKLLEAGRPGIDWEAGAEEAGYLLSDLAPATGDGGGQPTPEAAPGVRAPADEGSAVPVSKTQEAMVEDCSWGPAFYVRTSAYRLEGAFRPDALERALRHLMERHEVLRTAFVGEGGGVRGRILPLAEVPLSIEDARGWTEADLSRFLADEALRPMRLDREPPIRLRILRRGDGEHILVVGIHHVAYDLFLPLISHELFGLYVQYAAGLPPLDRGAARPFREFAAEERRYLASEEGWADLAYWLRTLEGAPLWPGYPGQAPARGPEGHRIVVEPPVLIDEERLDRLKRFAKACDATPFMVVLAGYLACLKTFTGKEDLVAGIITTLRDAPEFDQTHGPFFNCPPLRLRLSDRSSLVELTRQVRAAFLEMLPHKRYPLCELARRLRPGRDGARFPRCMLPVNMVWLSSNALQGELFRGEVDLGVLRVIEVPLADLPVDRPADLHLFVYELPRALVLQIRRSSALLDAETGPRFLPSLERILAPAFETSTDKTQT